MGDLGICEQCGTAKIDCGPPINEGFCPNKNCDFEREDFRKQLAVRVEIGRRKAFMQSNSPLAVALIAEAMKEWEATAPGHERFHALAALVGRIRQILLIHGEVSP